ncbi:hypothetical protein J1N10_20440 [Carboxylicivirga sp. A043]|uniref:hypothetical protein n=1 Tax=Carboxylicivirga litoralis TaxID=2816963 RepID=UPI0021CB9194|nr:hypothetical protein [Carboxylicivirga sp. A043]MCU4158354.1 hypothetical protein [Carboxylicivirga sp. A043]
MAYLLDQLETLVFNISKPEICLIKQGTFANSNFKDEISMEITAILTTLKRFNVTTL